MRLRIEVPLWRDLTTAKHPNADLPAEEDSASDATGSAERSPKLALPVPVGLAEPPEVGTEEATEDEDTMAEPNYTFAKGYGRFGIGYTRLATALGNFEQGSIEAESAGGWSCSLQRDLIRMLLTRNSTTNLANIMPAHGRL